MCSMVIAQCLEFRVQESYGNDVFNAKWKSIDICEKEGEINIGSKTVYILSSYKNSYGDKVYSIKEARGYGWPEVGYVKVASKMDVIEVKFLAANVRYSLESPSQKAEREEKNQELERKERNKKLAIDKTLYSSIDNALEAKEYFKALQLFSNLNSSDNNLLNKINAVWLPEKERLDKIYLTYKDQFIKLKKEYYSASGKDILLKYQNNIKTKEIEIYPMGILKSIAITLNPSTKILKEKMNSGDAYLYAKLTNNGHLISSVGYDGNYYRGRYNNKYVNSLNLAIIYDTSVKMYVPYLEFKNNEQLIQRSPILNSGKFQINYFSMPFPSEINKIYQKIINHSGRETLEKLYPEEILNLDSYESILYSDLKEIAYPGKGIKNDKYESLNINVKLVSDAVEQLLDNQKSKTITTNFYNPSILHLVKKMYPNADSLVFAFGDYHASLGKLGLHIQPVNKDFGKRGSFVPLTKGVVEYKNDKFIIYSKSGKYAEVSAEFILPESKVSLTNLLVDSLSLDSAFIRTNWPLRYLFYSPSYGYIKQHPINFQMGRVNKQAFLDGENVDYVFNENLIIQLAPLCYLKYIHFPNDHDQEKWKLNYNNFLETNDIYNFSLNFDGVGVSNLKQNPYANLYAQKYVETSSYDRAARKYFKEMTKYFQYKKEVNSIEATKSLLKANKYLESFKRIYLNCKEEKIE